MFPVNSKTLNCSSPCPDHSLLYSVAVTGIHIFSPYLAPEGKSPSNSYLFSMFECPMKNFPSLSSGLTEKRLLRVRSHLRVHQAQPSLPPHHSFIPSFI